MNVHKQLRVSAKYFSSSVINGELSLFKEFKIHLLTLSSYKCVQSNDLNIFAIVFASLFNSLFGFFISIKK